MARRLVERGVRFVQLMHAGWDQHRNLNTQLKIQCNDTDAPSGRAGEGPEAARPARRHARDLGRRVRPHAVPPGQHRTTPSQWGRDHHPYAFTLWMAGGGVKPGISYGETDEFGHNVVEGPGRTSTTSRPRVLHLLGIDHERLTYKFQGRDFRLTDVAGKVIPAIMA